MEGTDKNKIILMIGSSFLMEGVEDIRGFDEGYVSLNTKSGRINVEGRDLKIESLSKESGSVYITGNVSGVFIASEEKKKGIFGRFFA